MIIDFSIIARYSRIFCERKLKKYNIGFPEQIVLMYLVSKSTSNQEEIANHLLIDKGAITKTLLKLLDKNLITKVQNKNNKRENIIELTKKGKEIAEKMKELLILFEKSMLDSISKENLNQFIQTTTIIENNIKKLVEETI